MKKVSITLMFLAWTVPAIAEDQKPWWKFWDNETTSELTASPQQIGDAVKAKTSTKTLLFTQKEKQILNEYLLERVISIRNRQQTEYENEGMKKGNSKNKEHKHKDKKQKQLPPGLQKKLERGGQLPPGWQMKVARGEVLDAELYAQSRSLPSDIIDLLPVNPKGTSIRQIDDRIVRVMDATNVIVDVLAGKDK